MRQPRGVNRKGVDEQRRRVFLAGAVQRGRQRARLAVHDAELIVFVELPLDLVAPHVLLGGDRHVVALEVIQIGHRARELRDVAQGADLGVPQIRRGGGIPHDVEKLPHPIRQLPVLIVENLLEARIKQISEVRGDTGNGHASASVRCSVCRYGRPPSRTHTTDCGRRFAWQSRTPHPPPGTRSRRWSRPRDSWPHPASWSACRACRPNPAWPPGTPAPAGRHLRWRQTAPTPWSRWPWWPRRP